MTFLSHSAYIRNLAIVVIAYGMSINIVEVGYRVSFTALIIWTKVVLDLSGLFNNSVPSLHSFPTVSSSVV